MFLIVNNFLWELGGRTPNSLLIKYEKRMEKKQEVVVLRQSDNATQVMIKNPSEKLLAFMEQIAERSKKLKEEIMQMEFKEYKRLLVKN